MIAAKDEPSRSARTISEKKPDTPCSLTYRRKTSIYTKSSGNIPKGIPERSPNEEQDCIGDKDSYMVEDPDKVKSLRTSGVDGWTYGDPRFSPSVVGVASREKYNCDPEDEEAYARGEGNKVEKVLHRDEKRQQGNWCG